MAENKIVVVLASGRKYDSSPVDTGKGLFLSRVTVQGTGYAAIRGLYTTGWVYAEGALCLRFPETTWLSMHVYLH